MKQNTNLRSYDAWIKTFTGREFHFMKPVESEVDIMDIAVATSREGRFAGHCWSFYSVAQHCVYVSERMEKILIDLDKTHKDTFKKTLPDSTLAKFALCGLLHDASEAYIKDMPSPVKVHLDNYSTIESAIQDVIMSKFGVLEEWKDPDIQAIIHTVDKAVMATEVRDLIKHKVVWSMPEPAYEDLEIETVAPDTACVQFLYRFHTLLRRMESA